MKALSLSLSSALFLLLSTGCQSERIEAVPMPETSMSQPAQDTAVDISADGSAPTQNASVASVSGSGGAPAGSGPFTTPSGLSYRVLASGPAGGRSPTRTDSVAVHYRGTLTNGSVFDSSYDRGEPATFGVSQVIPGWTEALQLMKPGDKWMLHIPSHLAYGPRGMGGKIPPNSALVFQVELLRVL